ncbi:MAG: dTDP-glucose 4,6-dehydratase [Woeseiaceae bacterium]
MIHWILSSETCLVTDFLPKRMLVTGGAGFIGCNFVRHMLTKHKDLTIVTLDLLTYAGSLRNLEDLPGADRHSFVHADINDRPVIDKLLREHDIDCVAHFAAESHVDRSISGPQAFMATNILGTYNLLEAARDYWLGGKRFGTGDCLFHHISTDEVYGSLGPKDAPFCETTPYAPNSPYSASKAASDHLVRAWHHTFDLPVVTTNCSNNYGPYQHAEKLIPTIIRSCIEQQGIPVYGDGSNIRDWLYVVDHCAAIDAAICRGRPGETYNIGGLNEWANIDIVRLICRALDDRRPLATSYESLISFVDDRAGHDWRYAIDATKTAAELEWQPAETFESGISKTIDWYLDHQDHLIMAAATTSI